MQHLKDRHGAETEGPRQAGLLEAGSGLAQAGQLQSCFKSCVDTCVPKGLGASGYKQERTVQHLLWKAFFIYGTPHSPNCTVALRTAGSMCLSYQESQYHKVVEVGRNLQRSSSPCPMLKQIHLEQD